MNPAKTYNRLLWVLVSMCLLAGLIALISIGYLLNKEREAKRGLAALSAKAAALEAKAAPLRSNLAVVQMTMGDFYSAWQDDESNLDEACKSASKLRNQNVAAMGAAGAQAVRPLLDAYWRICPDTQGSWLPSTRRFLSAYLPAVTARTTGQFGAASRLYDEAVRLSSDHVVEENRLRALEGSAYSLLKLNKLDQAQERVAQARSLRSNSQFVFADLTSIKIMCAQGADPSLVQSSLAQVRAKFDNLIKGSTGDAQCFAKLDRGTIEADDELFLLCRKQNVAPIQIDSPAQCGPLAKLQSSAPG